METYKCQICGHISNTPGEHHGQPMTKQGGEARRVDTTTRPTNAVDKSNAGHSNGPPRDPPSKPPHEPNRPEEQR